MGNCGQVCFHPVYEYWYMLSANMFTLNLLASSDETVQIHNHPAPPTTSATAPRPTPPITHPKAVRAILPISLTPLSEPYLLTGSGDVIRVYDLSTPHEPELLNEVDAHWHDVTALRLWMRRSAVEGQAGKVMVEPWVISTSLDGTIRRWKLLGMCSLICLFRRNY